GRTSSASGSIAPPPATGCLASPRRIRRGISSSTNKRRVPHGQADRARRALGVSEDSPEMVAHPHLVLHRGAWQSDRPDIGIRACAVHLHPVLSSRSGVV